MNQNLRRTSGENTESHRKNVPFSMKRRYRNDDTDRKNNRRQRRRQKVTAGVQCRHENGGDADKNNVMNKKLKKRRCQLDLLGIFVFG